MTDSTGSHTPPNVTLHTAPLPKILFGAIAFLGVMGLIVTVLRVGFGFEYGKGLIPFFDLGEEGNLPTFFATALIAFNGALLAIIGLNEAQQQSSMAFRWKLLAFIFILLATDEAIGFHELSARPLRDLFGTTGIFTYAWVLLAIPLLLGFVVYYIRLLFHLPRKTALRFILSGAIYVGGAVGMEMVGGMFSPEHTNHPIIYAFCFMLEEIMELLGMALFAMALMGHCEENRYAVTIKVAPDSPEKGK